MDTRGDTLTGGSGHAGAERLGATVGSGSTIDRCSRRAGSGRGLTAVDRSSLERELRNLEDEVAYLRVKSRKGERITDRETRDLGERIDRFVQRTNDRNYNSSTSPGTSGPSQDG